MLKNTFAKESLGNTFTESTLKRDINFLYILHNDKLLVGLEILTFFLVHQRATSGTRKGSGRAGSGNLPGSAGSRNSSSGSG